MAREIPPVQVETLFDFEDASHRKEIIVVDERASAASSPLAHPTLSDLKERIEIDRSDIEADAERLERQGVPRIVALNTATARTLGHTAASKNHQRSSYAPRSNSKRPPGYHVRGRSHETARSWEEQ